MEIIKMFALVVLQNASFTLVSRARNSSSLMYHTIASVLSNGVWLLVIRKVVQNFDSIDMMLTYLVGSVVGSVLMHYVSMKYFEKKRSKKTFPKLVRPNSAKRNHLWEQIKMTDLQFIRLLKYALKPNKKGNKASIINALELVEIFKDK